MLVVVADNQAMTAIQGTPSVITTDPMPLNGLDRATAALDVHYNWTTGTSASVAYQAQASNDGVNYFNIGALADATIAIIVKPLPDITVYGVFIRFVLTLTINGNPGTIGGVCFDLHVNFDKA